MSQKVDPYLRPMYDALYEMLGFERVANFIERNVIEVAPLAFMRGRSLNDSFVILDEAQNTTNEQMKMFLTRIGFGSKAVVTGDITQVDLPNSKQSGLRTVIDILRGVRGIAFTMFNSATWCAIRWCSASCRLTRRTPPTMAPEAAAAAGPRRGYAARQPWVPRRARLPAWARAALAVAAPRQRAPRCCRPLGRPGRSRALNARYRRKDRPPTCCPSGAGVAPDGRPIWANW